MSKLPLSLLFGILVFLLVLSAVVSAAETALMALDRYRLRHLAKAGHRGARYAQALLQRPDRLIGAIMLGNTLANILAASISTLIALRLFGDEGVAAVTGLITLIVLIFGEVAPKTLGALHPEGIAFSTAYLLRPLLWLCYPLIWSINMLSNGFLRLLGVTAESAAARPISSEELRTVLNEVSAMIPRRHQKMLLSILDLEKVTVDDIMVPRNEISGLDLDQDWDAIAAQLTATQYSRLPVYRGNIDQVQGVLHLRDILHLLVRGRFSREELTNAIREPYFIPEGTPLNTQLLNFQRQKRRTGLVVDEYGDILGLVTLEDILEEIVGEFTTDPSATLKDIYPQNDGSYLVDGGVNVRELNRVLNWQLPTAGPKTLNGLILEYLETIPEPGTSLLLAGYPVEIVQTTGNAVKTVRLFPAQRKPPAIENAPGIMQGKSG